MCTLKICEGNYVLLDIPIFVDVRKTGLSVISVVQYNDCHSVRSVVSIIKIIKYLECSKIREQRVIVKRK